MMNERYTRSFEAAAVQLPNDEYIIEGRAIHYNTPTLINGDSAKGEPRKWFEVIDSAALSACDMSDVPMLLEHDRKEIVARCRNGSLKFENKPDGLYIRAKMETSKGREVWESVKAGLLTAFSFAFPVDSAIKRDGTHDGLPLMRVTEIKKLLDISVVFNPAYKGTFANARSVDMVDAMLCRENRERTKKKILLLLEVNK